MSAEELKAKGNEAFAQKNFDLAAQYFSDAIKLDSSNAVLYSNRSGAYASNGKYEEALKDAIECIKLRPDWPKGYSRKGFAEFKLGKIQESIETYKEGLKFDPSNSSLQEALEQAEAAHPETMTTKQVNLMVDTLFLMPKFQKYAQEDPEFGNKLKAILKETIKDPRNLQLAMALNPDPRITEALKILLKLPTSPEEEEELQEQERRREAAKAAETKKKVEKEKAAQRERSPEEIEADEWKEKGNKLYSKRQFAEALEAYNKAIEIFPANITYQTNKAAVYLEMGDFDACLAECQKILDERYETKPEFEKVAKVYVRMAVCYRRLNQYEKAIEMYEKALMEDNNRHYRAALSETKLLKEKKDKEDYINPELAEKHRIEGNEYFKKGLYPEAKREYDEAIRRNPQDARLYANRSAALMKLLELPMALADADKSLELDPNVPKVWARKGLIHTMMKEYHKSLNAYEKGLSIDKDNYDCRHGLEEVMRKIQETTTSNKVDEEQIKHAMADPEIQALLADPQLTMVLRGISEDPTKLKDALKDPRIAMSIQKLMAAGILKMST